jgi:hypothetical protein
VEWTLGFVLAEIASSSATRRGSGATFADELMRDIWLPLKEDAEESVRSLETVVASVANVVFSLADKTESTMETVLDIADRYSFGMLKKFVIGKLL